MFYLRRGEGGGQIWPFSDRVFLFLGHLSLLCNLLLLIMRFYQMFGPKAWLLITQESSDSFPSFHDLMFGTANYESKVRVGEISD